MKAAIFEKFGQVREALIVGEWEKSAAVRGGIRGFRGSVVFDN